MKVKLKLSNGKHVVCEKLGEESYGTYNGQALVADILSFEALDWLVDRINLYRSRKFDRVIMITGDERSGKSTLAFHLAKKLGFNFANLAFTTEQLLERMSTAPDGSVVWLDEAGYALYSDEWMGKWQRDIAKAFQIIGMKRYCFILCLPNRYFLIKKIRDHRVHYWLHCYTMGVHRGYARLRVAKKTEWSKEPFWDPVFTIRFPRAEGPEWEAYEKIKRENLDEMLNKPRRSRQEERNKIRLYRMIWYLNQKLDFSHEKIAELYGCTRQHITNIIREIRDNSELRRQVFSGKP